MAEEDNVDCVNMVEVLEEEQQLEENATAVLGGSDDKHCTYPKGSLPRQALYSCATCTNPETAPAGVCLACCLECHEGHDLYELYTKRNFTCDCGNSKFGDKKCKLWPEKPAANENNYNQNFRGLYCTCHRPYPDPEDQVDDAMIQCVICEDWLHGRHLKVPVPDDNNYEELICFQCVERLPFLMYYKHLHVLNDQGQQLQLKTDDHQGDVDVGSHQVANAATTAENIVQENSADIVKGTDSRNDDSGNLSSAESACDQGKDESAVLTKSEAKDTVEQTNTGEKTSADYVGSQTVDSTSNSNKPGTSSSETCRLSELDASMDNSAECHSIFWKEGWRNELCRCSLCKRMYADKDVPFIVDNSDTITMYEHRGRRGDGPAVTQYERGLEALSQMNRVQQVEMLHGFNDLKTELKDYLKKFADNGKVVREEDIKEFFSGLVGRKKQKVDMSYFCK